MNNKRKYLLLFAYNLRKNLPNSALFYSLYTLVKSIGIILISHNVSNLEDEVLSIADLFTCLTFYGKGYKKYISSYFSVLIIFFFLMVGFFIFTFTTIIIIKKNHGDSLYDKLSRFEMYLIKGIALILTFISFFSQHLIEYFTLGFLDVVLPNAKYLGNNSSSVDYIFLSFCVTNILLCEITSIAFFFITKSFSSVSRIGDPYIFSFSSSELLLIIMTSLQGVFALHNINETSESYHYYLNIFLSIALFLHCIFQFKKYNYYETNYSLFFEKFLHNFCLISSVGEIVLCHVCKTPFTQSYSFCKLTLEIINAFIFTKLNIMYINSIYLNGFIQKVFSDKLKLSPFDILAYVKEIIKFKNKEITFSNIFQIFSLHKKHCSISKCPCNYLSVIKWINQVKASQSTIEEKEVINRAYEDFVQLGEHEISRTIYYHKAKKYTNILDRLITLHIEYILNVKNQLCHALYLTSQYLIINNEKMSFMTQLILYEFKLITFDKLTIEKKKAAKTELSLHISIEKDEGIENYEKMGLFYQYTLVLNKITHLLSSCCDLLSIICDFCKSIEIKTTGLQKKCEYFFQICKNYQRNYNELCTLLLKQQCTIKHYEISYMLTAYFNLSIGQSEKIKNCFKKINSCNYFLLKENNELNSYKKFNQQNPMILFINPKNEFIIKYISISLCSRLNYTRQELINSEFNQLLPTELIPMHNIVLKNFVLSSKKTYKNNSFIFDKEKNMIPVKFEFNTILTLKNNFGIIISADFSYKESPYTRDYFLLLDKDMMIISMNKAFPDNFYFTLPIFQLLKMNFCSFFGINQEKITMKAKTLIHSNANVDSMEQENEALTVFSQRKMDSLFTDVKASDPLNCFNKTKRIAIHDTIPKKGIIKNLDNMNKMIEELGLDIEWYSRVNFLKERLELMKSVDIETDYTIVRIEELFYIIVNLKEKKNYTHQVSITNNINIISTTKSNCIESNQNIPKSKNTKFRSNRSIVNSNENMDITSTAKLKLSNTINQPIISLKPRQFIKKDNIILGSSSVSSMYISNRTSAVLFNLPEDGLKKNSYNKDDSFTYETRELFSSKMVQKYLHWLYKIFGLSIIILSLLPYIFNYSFIRQSKDLFDVTTYSLMIKSNIYFSSLELLSCCDKAEVNDQLNLKKQKVQLALLAKEMIDYLSIFSKTLNKLVKSPIKNIFDLLKTDNNYKKIMRNFETSTKSAEIYDELFYIHYYLIQLSEDNSFESCRLTQVFLKKNYLKLIDTDVQGPNYEETVIYYIINNVLFSLKSKMEELTQVTFDIIKLHFKNGKLSILLYNCILMLIALLLGGSFVAIIQYNKTNMQILLNMIYSKFSNENKLEKEIKAFQLILDEFSSETCLNYEEVKNSQPKSVSVSEFSTRQKKFVKKTKSKMAIDSKANKINNNGQHVKRYSNELTTLKLVKLSVGLTLFFILSFEIILSINVFLSNQLYNNLLFAIVISVNFINRVPKICELFLYTKISILLNDVNFITTPIDNYNNVIYSNYYNISLDTKANTIFTILQDSQFAFLYYQLMQIKGNVEEFMSRGKSTSVLNQLSKWENAFNSKEGLCIYGSLGQYSISKSVENTIARIKNVSNEVTQCRLYGNGMTMNTLNAYIDFSTQELKNIYVDFATFDPLARNPLSYLSNSIFSSIGLVTTGALKFIHDTVMYFIRDDLNQICWTNNLINLILSLVLMFLCLGIFIYVHFFLIQRIEKNISTLSFIQGINADNNKNH